MRKPDMCPTAKPNEPQPPSVKEWRDTVAEAAALSNGLWISFIFAMFYLLVAAGGVTHENLLLESAVKLPFLGVDLPLLRFFWLAPVILLIAHAYVLLHFSLLAQKVRWFKSALPSGSLQASAQQSLLPVNIFVQNLAGPAGSGRWLTGWPVWLMSCVSLLLAPVALLMFFELQFLPYHSLTLTIWHRVALILDLLLLWRVWPTLNLTAPVTATGFPSRRLGVIMHRGLAVVAVLFVWLVATFPGEKQDGLALFKPLQDFVVAGELDNTLRPTSWWSNRLVVANADLEKDSKYDTVKKLAVAPALHSLRDRNLERAVFTEANIPRVDFSFANLRGASFIRAHAQGAWFDHADLSGAQLDVAQLQGASFYAAQLEGASLDSAKLQGASLAAAQFQGAWLSGVDAEGASLASADLRWATLDKADLRGANLYDARLQGASLAQTDLRGASLKASFTWRADFRETDLGTAPRPRVYSLSRGAAPASCENLPDSCKSSFDVVRQLVDKYVPKGAIKDQMVVQLGTSLSENDPKTNGQNSDFGINLLDPSTGSYIEDPLPSGFWTGLVCVGDGAPFILIKLIDMLSDNKELNLPNHEALAAVVENLSNDVCAAKQTLSETLLMQARDTLREPSLWQQVQASRQQIQAAR